ncbi:MAG: hypothetical protein ABI867_40710 [Kofleriaceae bacterium]
MAYSLTRAISHGRLTGDRLEPDAALLHQASAISAGATDELVFGTLEAPVRWFHAALDAVLA